MPNAGAIDRPLVKMNLPTVVKPSSPSILGKSKSGNNQSIVKEPPSSIQNSKVVNKYTKQLKVKEFKKLGFNTTNYEARILAAKTEGDLERICEELQKQLLKKKLIGLIEATEKTKEDLKLYNEVLSEITPEFSNPNNEKLINSRALRVFLKAKKIIKKEGNKDINITPSRDVLIKQIYEMLIKSSIPTICNNILTNLRQIATIKRNSNFLHVYEALGYFDKRIVDNYLGNLNERLEEANQMKDNAEDRRVKAEAEQAAQIDSTNTSHNMVPAAGGRRTRRKRSKRSKRTRRH